MPEAEHPYLVLQSPIIVPEAGVHPGYLVTVRPDDLDTFVVSHYPSLPGELALAQHLRRMQAVRAFGTSLPDVERRLVLRYGLGALARHAQRHREHDRLLELAGGA